METSTTTKLIKSLIAARKKINDPFKNRDADTGKFKYGFADLDEVLQCVTGPCLENGIFISQRVKADTIQATVVTVLMHESGETLSSDGISISTTKADPQGVGIAVSYARRYDLLSFFGLAQTDEDGKNRFAATQPQALPETVAKVVPQALPAQQKSAPNATPGEKMEPAKSNPKEVPGTQSENVLADKKWIDRIYQLIESKKLALEDVLKHFQLETLEGVSMKKAAEIGFYLSDLQAAA
jgi:hypothetical protein